MAQNNARIIEKDIFADVTVTEAGSSEVIDLFGSSGGASKYSLQAIYDVQAPTAKTFDSGVAASLVVQDLTYTADVRGTAGNSITIQYIGDGTAGAETVDVTVNAIVVHMDPTAVTGSTATQIKTAVDASVPASALISVAVTGVGENVQAVAASTPLAGGVASEVDIVLNTVTVPTHGFSTGFKIQLTTTGTLPAGLATATDYFLIVVDVNTLQFATSLANALAGTAIDITNQGSSGAVNTITGVALAGASVTFQKSNNGTNWIDIQAATAIAADGSTMIEVPNVSYRYVKAVKALTSGQLDLKGLICVIGDSI